MIGGMEAEIATRFAKLEDRRKALVARVRALAPEKQTAHPAPNEFSPVEVLMHMALAERFDLVQLDKTPLSSYAGKKSKPSFMYRHAVQSMQAAKKLGTFGAMTPAEGVTFEEAEKTWADVRAALAKHFEEVKNPSDTMVKLLFLGRLSARDLLTLFEAHHHYHETRFPEV